MRNIITSALLILQFFFVSRLFSQGHTFDRTYDYVGGYALSIVEAQDSGFFIATAHQDSFYYQKLLLFKTDPKGEVIWAKKYWSDTCFLLRPFSIINTKDSGILITGLTFDTIMNAGAYRTHIFVLRCDKNGNLLWSKKLGTDSIWQGGRGCCLAADSGFIIGGGTSTESDEYGTIFKLSQEGDLIWSTNISDTGSLSFNGLIVSDNGEIIAGGFYHDTLSIHTKFIVSKLNTDGGLIWSKTYSFLKPVNSWSITQAPHGYYLSGDWLPQSSIFPISPLLVKIDTAGNFLWSKRYSSNWGVCQSLASNETADGGAVMMLETQNYFGGPNNGLLKVDSNGNFQWASVFPNQYATSTFSVIQSRDNGYLTGGYGIDAKFKLTKSNELGQVPCNDTLVNLDTYNLSCTVTSKGQYNSGIEIKNLALYVSPFILTGTIICLDSIINISTNTLPTVLNPQKPFNIYPNPFSIEAFLTTDNVLLTSGELILYDIFGVVQKRIPITSNKQKIERSNLTAGIYFYEVTDNGKRLQFGKLVIQ